MEKSMQQRAAELSTRAGNAVNQVPKTYITMFAGLREAFDVLADALELIEDMAGAVENIRNER